MDRRSLLRQLVFADALQGASGAQPRSIRPPGALAENLFAKTCTACGDCVSACPREIVWQSVQGGRKGLPVVDLAKAPCDLCGECIKVCEAGALSAPGGAGQPAKQLGTAVVNLDTCWSWQGQECTRCLDICPVPGAILAQPAGGVRVNPALCTGCAFCVHPCPSTPKSLSIAPPAWRFAGVIPAPAAPLS